MLMFILVISCTKEVTVFTEVEFELSKQHASEGFVNEPLNTVITIIPEAMLDDLEYTLRYSSDQGSGRFETSDNVLFDPGEAIPVEELSVSLNYIGTDIGEHAVTITITDSFGFSEEIEINYALENVPVTWTVTSGETQIELEEITPLTVTLNTNGLDTGTTYEALYRITEGEGSLSRLPENETLLLDEYTTVLPGTYDFSLLPTALGTFTLEALLRDSNGQELTATLSLQVVETIPVTALDLDKEEGIEMQVGETLECPVIFEPSNATDQAVNWSSEDDTILSVDPNGVFTANDEGTALVTVTSIDNPEAVATVLVTVVPAPTIAVTSISVAQEDATDSGITRQLVATVLPTDATDNTVVWSSGDTDIATVDENGLVTGVAMGVVVITATSVSDPTVSDDIELLIPPIGQNGNDITTFSLAGQNGSDINEAEHTVIVNVPDGTELNVAPNVLTVSPGATIDPAENAVQDFAEVVEYVVTAENGEEQIWTVSVVVAANQAPTASDDTGIVQQGASTDIDVLGNDTDADTPDEELSIITIGDISPTAAGNAEIVGNQIRFTAATDFEGTASFSYTINDGVPGNNATATVTVTINTQPNADPTAQDDVFTVAENGTLTENVLVDNGNGPDNDTDGNPLIIDRVNGNATNIGNPVTGSEGGLFTLAANGALTFNPNDAFDDLLDGETRQTNITYRINDNNGGVATATIFVTVTGISPANQAPDADAGEDITTTLPTDEAQLNGSNSDDSDGTVESYLWEQVSGPNTAVIVTPTAPITTVNGLVQGNYVFMLTVRDNDNAPATDVVEVLVNGALNTTPVAVNDIFTINENGSLTGNNVLADNGNGVDSDADGDPLTVDRVDGTALAVGVTTPGNNGGSFIIESDGTLNFETGGEFDGLIEGESVQTELSYRISDGNGGTGTALVIITINGLSPANQVPTADAGDNITVNLPENTATLDGSGSQDNDGDITLYLWEQVSGPNTPTIADQGAAITQISGLVEGTYIFMLTVTDDATDEATDTVEIRVNAAANTAPIAQDDVFTVAENNVLARGVFNDNGNGPDSDAEDDPLTVDRVNNNPANVDVSVNGSTGGVFTINAGGSLTFDPNGNFDALNAGESQETTVTYRITDGNGGTDVATVTVTVTGVSAANDAPTAQDDAFTVAENATASGNVLGNNGNGTDTDPEGATLTVNQVNGNAGNVATNVAGTNGGVFNLAANGSLSFDPNGEFDGLNTGETQTTSVNYTITDGTNTSNLATVTVTVTGVGAGNAPPIAQNDAFTVAENATGSGNVFNDNGNGADNDPEGAAITVNQVNGSAVNIGTSIGGTLGGRFTVTANGTFSFDPNGEFDGLNTGETQTTSVNYTITDGTNTSNLATVTVTVTGVTPTNDPPIAQDDIFSVAENATTSGNVLGNNGNGTDTDPEGATLTVNQVNGNSGNVGTNVAGTNGGLFIVAANGSLSFDPNGEFDALNDGETQNTTINYTISDGSNTSNLATVTVTVTGVSPANIVPNAVNDNYDVDINTGLIATVLENDEDLDGDTLTITAVTQPTNGTATILGGNTTVSYNPSTNYTGPDSFTYTISDGNGGVDTATVNITVNAVNSIVFSDETSYNDGNGNPFFTVSGTVTIVGSAATFTVNSFLIIVSEPGAPATLDNIVFTRFTIDGDNYEAVATEANTIVNEETPSYSAGTYNYSFEVQAEVMDSDAGWGGRVTGSQD